MADRQASAGSKLLRATRILSSDRCLQDLIHLDRTVEELDIDDSIVKIVSDNLTFHHIHLISDDPQGVAKWYEEKLGATIAGEIDLRNAPQITVNLDGLTILIRGIRTGEKPTDPPPLQDFEDYASHNTYGVDHFAFTYHGDLKAYCAELRSKGVRITVEPWEFIPGNLICYLAAPDGVSIELMQV